MPRRVSGQKLEKVISTKISAKNYELVEKYARELYIQKKIRQPTVSVLLRALINKWLRNFETKSQQKNTETIGLTETTSTTVESNYNFDMNRLRQRVGEPV